MFIIFLSETSFTTVNYSEKYSALLQNLTITKLSDKAIIPWYSWLWPSSKNYPFLLFQWVFQFILFFSYRFWLQLKLTSSFLARFLLCKKEYLVNIFVSFPKCMPMRGEKLKIIINDLYHSCKSCPMANSIHSIMKTETAKGCKT